MISTVPIDLNNKYSTIIIEAPNYVWELEFFPTCFLKLAIKPNLWVRFGIWVWFGLKGKDIKKGDKNESRKNK